MVEKPESEKCVFFKSESYILKILLSNVLLLFQKIHAVLTSEESKEKLRLYTERFPMKAVLLPIKSVGVQASYELIKIYSN